MSGIQSPIWSQKCSVGFMSGLRVGQSMTSVPCCARKAVVLHAVLRAALSWTYTNFRPKPPSPREACYRGEEWSSIGGWGLHPAPPDHFSRHGGWHTIQWLRGHGYHPWAGCTHLSVSLPACCAYAYDHHCETAWRETHHWRHSASSASGTTFWVFSHTYGGFARDTNQSETLGERLD